MQIWNFLKKFQFRMYRNRNTITTLHFFLFIFVLLFVNLLFSIPILNLLSTEKLPPHLAGKEILMIHDTNANDMDDFVLHRLLESLGANVSGFDVWHDRIDGAALDEKNTYTLLITGPITPLAHEFLSLLKPPEAVLLF